MIDCTWVQEHAPELVRDAELPEGVAEHTESCAECRSVTDGAAGLRGELDAWTVPEAPDDLVAKTLAKLAMAQLSAPATEAAEPESQPIPEPTPAPALKVHRGGRRSSIMILTGTRSEEVMSEQPPTRRTLFVRLLTQAAAAALLFAACTTFVAVFYPAVTFALEDRRVKRCQRQLNRLAKAAAQYHAEHPEAGALHGHDLRQALIQGGYADELDFVCTGQSGEHLGERSFVGVLPAGSEAIDPDQPLFWDRFSNHSSGFNVAYPDGRVETVSVEQFASWRRGSKTDGDQ